MFLLSAAWKVRHERKFRAAYLTAVPQVLRGNGTKAARIVPLLECATAMLLLLPLATLARVGALMALVLLGTFTLSLTRLEVSGSGCGCWDPIPGEDSKAPLIARNVVVASLAILGLASIPTVHALQIAFCLPVGVMISLMLMELPRFVAIAATHPE